MPKDEAYGDHHEMDVRGARYNFDADLRAGRQERPTESQAGANQLSSKVLIDSLCLKGVLNHQNSQKGKDHGCPIEVAKLFLQHISGTDRGEDRACPEDDCRFRERDIFKTCYICHIRKHPKHAPHNKCEPDLLRYGKEICPEVF